MGRILQDPMDTECPFEPNDKYVDLIMLKQCFTACEKSCKSPSMGGIIVTNETSSIYSLDENVMTNKYVGKQVISQKTGEKLEVTAL
jgi:hypothetical protein